jgi:hypothetical protein
MDRRKFLKGGAAALAAPLALGTSARLYGTPASILPRVDMDAAALDTFKLPLSKAAVPTTLWDSLARVGFLWRNVISSEAESMRFFNDPKAYLESVGLDGSDRTLTEESVVLLRSMCDPAFNSDLASGNYEGVFDRLIATGVLSAHDPSVLETRISDAMNAQREEILASAEAVGSMIGADQRDKLAEAFLSIGEHISEDDLFVIAQFFKGGTGALSDFAVARPEGSFFLVVVAAGIAALVVAYVSVAIAVTVAILGGVVISLGVRVAVAGSNPSVPLNVTTGSTGHLQPFDGTYARLDPSLMSNTNRLFRLGKLTGNPDLQTYAVRRMIKAEVEAVVNALHRTGIINMPPEPRARIIDALSRYSANALDVQSS